MGDIMQINSVAKFSDFSVLNSDFTRARCRVMYTGRNRNYTDITESALNKLIERKGYANVPVVAHLYKGDDGKWRVGGHDCEIKLKDDGGIEFNDLTRPFGVVPEDCNPSFEDVVETSGEVKRYFCVDVLLWSHRYNIMDAAKSDEWYFNQSMEITINHCSYDNDGYCVIDDFNLSALCLLNHDPYNKNNEVEPCFPSASVKKFEMTDDFQNEFSDLLCKLKEFTSKKEENILDFSFIKNNLNSEYFMLSCSSDSVIAMRKKNFEIYEIPYSVTKENGKVTFDYDRAVRKYISVSDKDTGISAVPIFEYVETLKANIAAGAEKVYSDKLEAERISIIKDFTEKYNDISAKYAALKDDYNKALKKIESYDEAEKQAAADKHKAEIDAVIGKYSDKLAGNSEYMCYTAKVDYSKTTDEVERDMFVIIGKSAAAGTNKVNFSATWGAHSNNGVNDGDDSPMRRRYGNLFDRFE